MSFTRTACNNTEPLRMSKLCPKAKTMALYLNASSCPVHCRSGQFEVLWWVTNELFKRSDRHSLSRLRRRSLASQAHWKPGRSIAAARSTLPLLSPMEISASMIQDTEAANPPVLAKLVQAIVPTNPGFVASLTTSFTTATTRTTGRSWTVKSQCGVREMTVYPAFGDHDLHGDEKLRCKLFAVFPSAEDSATIGPRRQHLNVGAGHWSTRPQARKGNG